MLVDQNGSARFYWDLDLKQIIKPSTFSFPESASFSPPNWLLGGRPHQILWDINFWEQDIWPALAIHWNMIMCISRSCSQKYDDRTGFKYWHFYSFSLFKVFPINNWMCFWQRPGIHWVIGRLGTDLLSLIIYYPIPTRPCLVTQQTLN